MNQDAFHSAVESARRDGHERLIIPIHRRLSADTLTPVSAFQLLRQDAFRPFLLESVEGGEKLARYSFLGRNPYLSVRAVGNGSILERPGKPDETRDATVFEALREVMRSTREVPVPDLPRLTCGGVGFLSYDVVRLLEHLPDAPPADVHLPDGLWCFYDTTAAFDHVKHQLVLVAGAFIDPESDPDEAFADAHARLDELETVFSRPIPASPPRPIHPTWPTPWRSR